MSNRDNDSEASINRWLEGIPEGISRKRRRGLVSPGNNNKMSAPPDDGTPRPLKRVRSNLASDLSDRSRSLSSLRSSDKSSRRNSPQRQLQQLRLNPKGIRFQPLSSFTSKPSSLESLLDAIDDITEGKGIVPERMREQLMQEPHEDFKWARRSSHYYSADLEYSPSPDDVLEVLDAANECDSRHHAEVTWNAEVHQLVLGLAFRQGRRCKFRHLVNFTNTTVASIMPEYGIPTTSKKVDFCIYIDPENDDETWKSLEPSVVALQIALPENALNFTDFIPLDRRPIALSIETKKPSEGFEGAKVQLSVWLLAQWTFLRCLAKPPGSSGGEGEGDREEEHGAGSWTELLPAFLPGIIIQGHDWHLIITTPEGEDMIFWGKVTIGSTSSSKGIYRIIRTLQVLREWAKESYWPYFQDLITKTAERLG
ncbi:hypothetical protein PT974_11559 [Cladobotryum mycophilum]|uniref:PD-(D/E)XK nuclease-like domain-containing protein n=1 Tax=Cladobotryum mycophilum TaxID=491253 RepID=A0ABR0S5K4_9HYPO